MQIFYSRSTRIVANPDRNDSKDTVYFFHQNQDLKPENPQFNQYTTKMISLLVSFRIFLLRNCLHSMSLYNPLCTHTHTHTHTLWWLWVYTSLMSIFFCPPSPFAPAFDSRSRWLLWYEWTRKEVCPPPCLALIGSSRMPWWLDHSAVLWVCQSNYSVTFKGRVSNFWKPMLIFEITETPTPQGSRPYFDRSAPHIRSLRTSSSD